MPTQSPSLVFSLTPEATEAFLLRLTDPDASFNDLVSGYNTTPAALSAFMARPDIADRIHQLESGAATKARLTATSALPSAAVALRVAIQGHIHVLCNTPYNDQDLRQVEARSRLCDRARKQITLTMRLASFHPAGPGPAPARRRRPPQPDPTAAIPSPIAFPTPAAASPTGSATAIPSPEHWTQDHTQDLRAAIRGDPPPIRPEPTGVWVPFELSPTFPTAWLQPPQPTPISKPATLAAAAGRTTPSG